MPCARNAVRVERGVAGSKHERRKPAVSFTFRLRACALRSGRAVSCASALALLAGFLLFLAGPAFAQGDYPSKPIRLIVPYPPGGPTDIIGRLTSSVLTKRLSENVVVDNRGGAATAIGAEMAARSPADGYTLLLSSETTFAVT